METTSGEQVFAYLSIALAMFFLGGNSREKILREKIIESNLKPISIIYEDRNNDGLTDKVEQFDFGELIMYAKKDNIGEIKYNLNNYRLIELPLEK